MKRVLTTWLLLLFLLCKIFAQIHPGARQIALANSDISSSNDVFSLFGNPAGLSSLTSREAGLFYSPAPFGVKEQSSAYMAYCEPASFGSLGAGFGTYGFELFRETKIALGYGKAISKIFFAGISAVYHNVSIRNYGSKGVFLFNIGAIARLNDQVGFGFSIENLSRSTIANESNQIPSVLWAGIDLNFIEQTQFTAAVRKEIGFNPSLHLGTEYSIIDFLKLRIGVCNEPDLCSAGFGIIYNFIQADYAFSSHKDLGLTHQFGLLIRFNNN